MNPSHFPFREEPSLELERVESDRSSRVICPLLRGERIAFFREKTLIPSVCGRREIYARKSRSDEKGDFADFTRLARMKNERGGFPPSATEYLSEMNNRCSFLFAFFFLFSTTSALRKVDSSLPHSREHMRISSFHRLDQRPSRTHPSVGRLQSTLSRPSASEGPIVTRIRVN